MKRKQVNPEDVILLSARPQSFQLELKDRALAVTAEGITISDNTQPDNPIVYANRGFERLTGYAREEVLGKNCRFLQGEDTAPEAVEEIRDAIKEERSCSVEILNYRKDGTPFWNLLSITPISDKNDNVINYLGIQSDITKRKNYEQELRRLTAELEERNRRMKKDLEEARQLQLAMLPDELPRLPYLEIAVKMTTADEVGGDYYDFFVGKDNMTFAIGDATGHGLKAGTIVTATKTLLNSYASLDDPVQILKAGSASLKEMGFKNMYMAMLIAKISKQRMVVSSAGMPFTYIYSDEKKEIRDIELKGMPLGSFPDFPYVSKAVKLKKGDTYLFHSDGLAECFNPDGQMFGESRVRERFREVGDRPPSKIVNHLTRTLADWMQGVHPKDDITMVVMKCK